MTKKEGKVYEQVKALLRARGIIPTELAIATHGRGSDHMVILGEDVIGNYNHKSRKLTLAEGLSQGD